MRLLVREALGSIFDGRTAASCETETLDFKQDSDRGDGETLRNLSDAALCLANTRGGTVLLGVADKIAGPDAFLGTKLAPETIRLRVHASSRPPLLVDVEELDYCGHRLIEIRVPETGEIHSDGKGRAPRRIGTDCIGMTPSEQQRLREERAGVDWSAAPVDEEVEIAAEALAATRRRLAASFNPVRRALVSVTDLDLERALGLVAREGRWLRAGQVFLGRGGMDVVYLYRETPGGEPVVVERLAGPLVVLYDRVIEMVALRRRLTPVSLPDGQQLQVEDFPELVVREALTNALMHRDFHLRDPVVIEHSPQVLTITSPGPLVAGVSVENILTHPSKPRNRTLAGAVRTIELAEEVGRGVDRMYREMVRSGRPTPTIEASFDQVRVTLVGTAPDVNIARYVAQLPSTVQDDTDAMIVLLKLCASRTVSAQGMVPLLQKGIDETEASLRHLASDLVAMIEPTRQTMRRAHPNYRLREEAVRRLGTAVPYARHTSEEIERRVVAHVREYHRITNATVQNLFSVKMGRAHQIIADLVARGILVKSSKAQRGPGVEYAAGPSLPARPTRRRPAERGGGEGGS